MYYLKFLRRFFVLLGIGSFFYIIFYTIFFIFLASLSVDGLIGFSMFVLFVVVYRLWGVTINKFFLSISRNVWLHFVSLIFLTYLVKHLFINISKNLKKTLVFQIASNYLVFDELNNILNDLNVKLLDKLISQGVLLEIYYKSLIIKNLVRNNIVSTESLIFLAYFVDLNIYFFNSNTIGWLKY